MGGLAPRGWTLRAGVTDRWHPPRVGGLLRGVRRTLRRAARVTRLTSPTHTHYARPVGLRMGKGRGKPAGRFGWATPGTPLLGVVGAPPPGVAARAAHTTWTSTRW